jgi:hypothetical protein
MMAETKELKRKRPIIIIFLLSHIEAKRPEADIALLIVFSNGGEKLLLDFY